MAADKLLTQLNLLLAKVEALQTDLMDLRACTQRKEKCKWILIKIDQMLSSLKAKFPSREATFTEIFMQYDQHTNLTFFAIEDLEALDCYLSLTLSSLEALDKEETSPDPYWKHIKEIYEFLDELQTLEEGDPPGERSLAARSMRDVMPELRDKARKAIRVKAQDRVLAVVLDVPEDNEE